MNTVEVAAECVYARHKHEEWFVASKPVKRKHEPSYVQLVVNGCPFSTHRPVFRFEVRVVSLVEARTSTTAKDQVAESTVYRTRRLKNYQNARKLRRLKREYERLAARQRTESQKKSDEELVKAIEEFTDGILGPSSSTGACFLVCAPLQAYLKVTFGVFTEMMELEFGFTNHFVLALRGRGLIIDPTADQFNGRDGYSSPRVYFGKIPDHFHAWAKKARAES